MTRGNDRRLNKWMVWIVSAWVVVLVAGCSGAGESNPTSESNPASQQTTTGAPRSEAAEKQTKTLQDAFGQVELPANPKRVTALYREDYLVALGVKPIVQYYNPMFGKQDYLNLEVPLFDVTGSIEALLVAEPDLIIAGLDVDAEAYAVYSKVAPTFRLTEEMLSDPRKTLTQIGELLGMEDKVDQVIKDYEARIADVKGKLQAAIGNEKVAVLRMNVMDKSINIFGIHNGFVGPILYQDLGLKAPTFAEKMTETNVVLPEEVIPDLDADHIILLLSNGTWEDAGIAEALKDRMENPLWKNVPAVKNGKVYTVERSYWQTGAIMANGKKMDDLLKLLVS